MADVLLDAGWGESRYEKQASRNFLRTKFYPYSKTYAKKTNIELITEQRKEIMLKPRKRITKKQIKEDPLVTTYFKSIDFVKEHQQKITTGLIVILAVVVLLVMLGRSKRTANFNASEQLAKANTELSQNKTQEAIDILLNMIDNYSGTKSAANGVYLLAKAYYEKGDYDKSLLHFENYLDDYGDDKILASAAFSGVAASYEQLGRYQEAADNYKKSAKKYPEHFNAAQQLFDAGRCYMLQSQFAQAKECYQLIVDKYTESNLKNDAELYLAKLNG